MAWFSRSGSSLRQLAPAAILGALASCATAPPPASAPASAPGAAVGQAVGPTPGAGSSAAPTLPASSTSASFTRARSRWVAVDWAELPGWADDRTAQLWPALQSSCRRPPPGWSALCARAWLEPPTDDAQARQWLRQWLQPWRLETLDGASEGLITGYYEPLIDARRQPRGAFRVPLHSPPPELATQRPFYTRQQLDTLPAAMDTLRGREIAYVANPLDALVLQIQGSGRLRLTETDGTTQTVRLAFAGHNDQPYRSVGRWLVERGEITLEAASWPAIKAWAERNPRRVQEMLWANPRVIFFREEPLPDPGQGPRGAQGVPLVPGRSIAVDPGSVPYGTPVWLDTTEPLSNTPLRRLVMAQDTGGAIVGAVRADYFWGWGATAEAQAGRMKQPLRAWALWPVGQRPD